MSLSIQGKKIGESYPPFIIAEAGVNHNGDFKRAIKLIDVAARAGADAIKFQTFKAHEVVTQSAGMAKYQEKNLGKKGAQLDMLSMLELRDAWYPKLITRCAQKGIIFLSTPHGGFASVDLLEKLRVPAFKFGSGDLTNIPLLVYAARFGKPMILGTGMATMQEVKRAVEAIRTQGHNKKIIVLHCTTNYPCPPDEVNLKAMNVMEKELGVPVGYSDHTLGTQVPIMAATLGAVVIEKHFTLDTSLPGPDHACSLEPEELGQMISAVRLVKVFMGSSKKMPTIHEIAIMASVRKSVVTVRAIKKGELFTKDNIAIKRPAGGLKPELYSRIIGSKSTRTLSADHIISHKDYVSST